MPNALVMFLRRSGFSRKFRGGKTFVEIGDQTTLREYVTADPDQWDALLAALDKRRR